METPNSDIAAHTERNNAAHTECKDTANSDRSNTAHEARGDIAHAKTHDRDSDCASGTVAPKSDSGASTPKNGTPTSNEAILQKIQQMNQLFSESQRQMQQWIIQQMSVMQNAHTSGQPATLAHQNANTSGQAATPTTQRTNTTSHSATLKSQQNDTSSTPANPAAQTYNCSPTAQPGNTNHRHPSGQPTDDQHRNRNLSGEQIDANCHQSPPHAGTVVPVNRRRLTQAAIEKAELIAKIRPYIIKNQKHEGADIKMRESLHPTLPVARYDAVVRELLGHLQKGAPELRPRSHKQVMPPFPSSSLINEAREKLYFQFYESVSKVFTFRIDESETEAVPLPVLHMCINSARQIGITNPIFLGQTIMRVVEEHPKTVKLWQAWKAKYTQHGDLLPVHIIDLFTEAALARGITHRCPHLRAVRAIDNLKQSDNQTAKVYVAVFFRKLDHLWAYYDQGAEKNTWPNNAILAKINSMSGQIFQQANPHGLLYKRMAIDLDTNRQLPWGMWFEHIPSWSTVFARTREAYARFAREVDTTEDQLSSLRGGGNKQRGHNNKSSNKSSSSPRKNNKFIPPFQTDPTEICTSFHCKRSNFPTHKVGARNDCGRICNLKLHHGIDCPTTAHEVGHRHFYRKGCRDALERHQRTHRRNISGTATGEPTKRRYNESTKTIQAATPTATKWRKKPRYPRY